MTAHRFRSTGFIRHAKTRRTKAICYAALGGKLHIHPIVVGAMLLVAATAFAEKNFVTVGTWSNVVVSQGEDPHAMGFELELWKRGGEFVGFLHQYVGPAGDPPIGRLEHLVVDEKTGEIAFSVRMSVGSIYSLTEETWVSSRDLYKFRGTMTAGLIKGKLDHMVLNGAEPGPVTEQISLKGSRPNEAWNGKSYEEWESFYESILKYRGPNWQSGVTNH